MSERNREADVSRDALSRKCLKGIATAAFAWTLLSSFENAGAIAMEAKARIGVTSQEEAVSAFASRALGHSVRVDCDTTLLSMTDTSETISNAFVSPFQIGIPIVKSDVYRIRPNTMHMRQELCDDLENFANNPRAYSENRIHAVYVAAHEDEHIRGVHDEAAASCYAVQKLPDIYRRITPIDGNHLARVVARTISSPAEYYSEECRPGGALDLGTGGPFLQKSN